MTEPTSPAQNLSDAIAVIESLFRHPSGPAGSDVVQAMQTAGMTVNWNGVEYIAEAHGVTGTGATEPKAKANWCNAARRKLAQEG